MSKYTPAEYTASQCATFLENPHIEFDGIMSYPRWNVEKQTAAHIRKLLEANKVMREGLDSGIGVYIGKVDRNGKRIHIGDTLIFDAKEWGCEHEFTIELIDGEISGSGTPSDWSNWCEIKTQADKLQGEE